MNIDSEPPTSSVEPIVNMNSPKPSSLLIPASQVDAKKTVDIIAGDTLVMLCSFLYLVYVHIRIHEFVEI